MKTLFIQTHDLASKLDPNTYMCNQIASVLEEKTGRFQYTEGSQKFDLLNVASLLILTLVRDTQNEEFIDKMKQPITPPYQYTNGLSKVNGFYLDISVESSSILGFGTTLEAMKLRQRLINSLLTRPDSTLCVLLPE